MDQLARRSSIAVESRLIGVNARSGIPAVRAAAVAVVQTPTTAPWRVMTQVCSGNAGVWPWWR